MGRSTCTVQREHSLLADLANVRHRPTRRVLVLYHGTAALGEHSTFPGETTVSAASGEPEGEGEARAEQSGTLG